MRLWHIDLVEYLDDKRLLSQHRECCALRGNGWGRNHSTVNYVFKHDYKYLVAYHWYVMMIMEQRGYTQDMKWWRANYRGKNCAENDCVLQEPDFDLRYPEHNDKYLKECIERLKEKGATLKVSYEKLEEVLNDKLSWWFKTTCWN